MYNAHQFGEASTFRCIFEQKLGKIMTQEFKDKLLKRIIAKINEKQQIINSGKEELSTLEHGASDDADKSSAVESQELLNSLNKKHKTDLENLKKAMRNIRSEDFGYCEDCGIEIPHLRLEARPETTTCVDCGNIREHKNKHMAA